MFGRARSNTDGTGTFPANQYSMAGEYGPASNDIHHRAHNGGTNTTKRDFRPAPVIMIKSGAPFGITTGTDVFGDQLFRARPGIASDPNQPGVIRTVYGLLNPNPKPGEATLPRNFGRSPGSVTVNLRLARTFGFGPARERSGGGGDFSG